MIKPRNIFLALKEQGPPRRAFRNFFVTGNAWGMFHKNSHISVRSGEPKVKYNRRSSAQKAAESMSKKHDKHFSFYKCVFCDGYHIGKNKDNK